MMLPVGLLLWFIQRNRRWLSHNQRQSGDKRGFTHLVIKLLTKGKQKGQMRGAQQNPMMVCELCSPGCPLSLLVLLCWTVNLRLKWLLHSLMCCNAQSIKVHWELPPANSAATSPYIHHCRHIIFMKTIIACHENQFDFLHRAELKRGLIKVMKHTASQGRRLCLEETLLGMLWLGCVSYQQDWHMENN